MRNKCSVQAMCKVIRRNSPLAIDKTMPEHDLVFAILNQAVGDLTHGPDRDSARQFFSEHIFDQYCGMVRLNGNATRDLLVRGGFLEQRA